MSTPPQSHTDDSRPAAAQAELAKFVRDLHVAGLSARTIQAYSSYLGRLQAHGDHTTAAMLSEEQLREWLAMLVRERQYRAGSLKVVHAAIKKFYRLTCPRDWRTLREMKVQAEATLPEVLSREEVFRLLGQVRREEYRVCLWTIYSLGLRLSEGVNLQVQDIRSDRGLVHVHRGKGSIDRVIPLPQETLRLLRTW